MDEQEKKIPLYKRPRLTNVLNKILAATEVKIAFKTSLAASVSLVIGLTYSKFFNRPDMFVSGLWCVMAAIVVMQAHVGGTYKAAWIRFLGVLIGSIAGAVFMNLIGIGAVSLGFSVFFTIILCALLNIKDSFRIAGLSTAIIIVMGGLHPEFEPWVFSFYRFLDSCIGILVAVIIAHLIWPERALEKIQKNISKTLNLLSKYFRLSIDLEPENSGHKAMAESTFAEIVTLLEENYNYRKEAEVELFDKASLRNHWMLITNQLEVIFEAVDALKKVQKETIAKIFDDGLAKQLSETTEKIDFAFQSLEKLMGSEAITSNSHDLDLSLNDLNKELVRFRATRTTRKFSMEDVENFFVFFYSLRAIGEALIKMEHQIKA